MCQWSKYAFTRVKWWRDNNAKASVKKYSMTTCSEIARKTSRCLEPYFMMATIQPCALSGTGLRNYMFLCVLKQRDLKFEFILGYNVSTNTRSHYVCSRRNLYHESFITFRVSHNSPSAWANYRAIVLLFSRPCSQPGSKSEGTSLYEIWHTSISTICSHDNSACVMISDRVVRASRRPHYINDHSI